MIRAARATDLRDDACESPSSVLIGAELDRVLREISGTRARLYEYNPTLSRLHIQFIPPEGSELRQYNILFVGTERCEASIHFTVTDARFTTVEDGIDGSRVILESNQGETRITSTDALLIIQDDSEPLDIDTLTNA
ncbi:MAG: hypothetical protein AAF357_19010 [Verrucomicrobiota bacterium]